MNRALLLVATLTLAACGTPAKVITVPDGPIATGGDRIAATSVPPAPEGAPAAAFGDGLHTVFTDVQPGTYRTGGSTVADIPVCSWKLYAGDRAIASGSASAPVSIVVLPEYTAVESHSCLDWQRVGDAP